MPANRKIGRCGSSGALPAPCFRRSLPVRRRRPRERLGREGLGDGDEPDGGGIASGPAGGSRDAIADVGQPGGSSGVDHAAQALLLQLDQMPLASRRSGRRRELQIGFELGGGAPPDCLRSPAPYRAGSATRRGSGSPPTTASLRPSCRRSRDDALVEHRVGVAAAGRARAPSQRLGAGRGRLSNLRVRCRRRQPVVGLGVVRLQLDRLLVGLRPCRSPSSGRARSRCCRSSRSSSD